MVVRQRVVYRKCVHGMLTAPSKEILTNRGRMLAKTRGSFECFIGTRNDYLVPLRGVWLKTRSQLDIFLL